MNVMRCVCLLVVMMVVAVAYGATPTPAPSPPAPSPTPSPPPLPTKASLVLYTGYNCSGQSITFVETDAVVHLPPALEPLAPITFTTLATSVQVTLALAKESYYQVYLAESIEFVITFLGTSPPSGGFVDNNFLTFLNVAGGNGSCNVLGDLTVTDGKYNYYESFALVPVA